ncbi:Inner capsid protein VP2, partial [Bienertia sinuspersici]
MLCCDTNTSNFVESFNSILCVDRCRPILTLLEGIRRVCMVRIAARQQQAEDWNEDGLFPKIVKIMKDIGHLTMFCEARMSAPGEFEVHKGKSQFPLSLNKHKCACGAWQLTWIPCRHAVRAMMASKLDPHKFISLWYSVKCYKATYSSNIWPIPDHHQWPNYTDLPKVLPPPLKRGVGRPSRNRRREEGEEANRKRSRTVKCSICGHFGHNKTTCKGALTHKELQASQLQVTKNRRNRDQSDTAKKPSKKEKKQSKEVLSQTGSQPLSLSQDQ